LRIGISQVSLGYYDVWVLGFQNSLPLSKYILAEFHSLQLMANDFICVGKVGFRIERVRMLSTENPLLLGDRLFEKADSILLAASPHICNGKVTQCGHRVWMSGAQDLFLAGRCFLVQRNRLSRLSCFLEIVRQTGACSECDWVKRTQYGSSNLTGMRLRRGYLGLERAVAERDRMDGRCLGRVAGTAMPAAFTILVFQDFKIFRKPRASCLRIRRRCCSAWRACG
jgi:hypothetical protein